MTIAKTVPFEGFVIAIGDGGSPEAFAARCGLMTKSADITASTASSDVPDCDDESLPATTITNVKSVGETLSGNGIFEKPDYSFWRGWAKSGAAKNIKVIIRGASADGAGYWIGSYVLTSFKNAVNKGEQMTADMTLMAAAALGDWVSSDMP